MESRRCPAPRFLGPGGYGDFAAALLGFLSLATLAIAGIYAAVLGWSHVLVEFPLAVSAICLSGRRLAGIRRSPGSLDLL